MMALEKIDEALDSLRPGLSADGFRLLVESVEDNGVVTVVIEANENACHDCLVPDEMLTGMIEMAIRPVHASFTKVQLIKRFQQ